MNAECRMMNAEGQPVGTVDVLIIIHHLSVA
ncbi:MAG: hypothetical protein JWN13_1110 [Betaproteobacteria bacterium]|jgi:hypothetical protein|nr:hypothetical protein [Betaproteobacteria bacterium]